MTAAGDGVIEFEEFVDFEIAQYMERLDIDDDDKVSLESFLMLAGPTTNIPGQPTYEQRREQVARRFNEVDTNRDGVIDADERQDHAVGMAADQHDEDHYVAVVGRRPKAQVVVRRPDAGWIRSRAPSLTLARASTPRRALSSGDAASSVSGDRLASQFCCWRTKERE